jgi:hypothetical protein
VLGQTIRIATYMQGPTCGFITGGDTFQSSATFGWRVDATPVTLAQDFAVVRVRWSREIVDGKPSGEEPTDLLMRFRAGEAATLDSAVLKNSPAMACRNVLATLIVALKETEPYRERVVSTDLWLVHRGPDGKERTQQLNVRGGFNETMPFVFDDIKVGADVLDVNGTLTPRSTADGSILLEFSAERRWSRAAQSPDTVVVGNGVTSLALKPGDVTSISIPLEVRAKPLPGHTLSIRVRSAQIR